MSNPPQLPMQGQATYRGFPGGTYVYKYGASWGEEIESVYEAEEYTILGWTASRGWVKGLTRKEVGGIFERKGALCYLLTLVREPWAKWKIKETIYGAGMHQRTL